MKKTTTLTLDDNLVRWAKKEGVNISKEVDQLLFCMKMTNSTEINELLDEFLRMGRLYGKK